MAGVDADVVGAFVLVGEAADKAGAGAGAGRLGVARQMISNALSLEDLEVWLLGPPEGCLSRSQVYVDMNVLKS